jgi:hypothetical protein
MVVLLGEIADASPYILLGTAILTSWLRIAGM